MHKNIAFNLADMRGDYAANTVDESKLATHPMQQFDTWFQEAQAIHVLEPNAMILATCNAKGQPSARTITIKHYDEAGMIFFSDKRSHKGLDIQQNTAVSGVFWWPGCDRQIRIQGNANILPQADTEKYFATRPRCAQIVTVSFPQGSSLASRADLINQIKAVNQKNADAEIECPSYWVGYHVEPTSMEFQQMHKDYLHYRISYTKQENDAWNISYISP